MARNRGKTPLHQILHDFLDTGGRGAAAMLARNTCLTEPEIANWRAGRRQLTPEKTLEAVSWLVSSSRASLTLSEPR